MKTYGGFFAIDRRIWADVCNKRNVNNAVAYLVLAQGTGRDNGTTAWAATSVKKYAGISWIRATECVHSLIEGAYLKVGEAHTKTKPRYEILSWTEIVTERSNLVQARLTEYERMVLAEARDRREQFRPKRSDQHVVEQLEAKGLLCHLPGRGYEVLAPPEPADPELIWLPNTLVTGTTKGEEPPVKRLRATGDIETLRLLVDLYGAHNLRDDGGIAPRRRTGTV
jgi:hypothetical protein